MVAKKKDENATIDILRLEEGHLRFCVVGVTPILLNRMSEKAARVLLLPGGKKNAAEKASSLKHRPPEEYRAAPYIDPDPSGPTLIQFLSTAFKGAMMQAALDIPSVTKAKIERLVWVNGERIPLYGVPKLHMAITRSSDMNRTPDVRTRAIISEWACRVSVSFRKPILREQGIANLLAASGVTPGVGDWRVGKGSGTHGQFEIVSEDDARFVHLTKHGGREAQIEALTHIETHDLETEELLAWYHKERERRGFAASTEFEVEGAKTAKAAKKAKKKAAKKATKKAAKAARRGNGAHARA